MYRVVALIGKSGVGKDTTLAALCQNEDFHKIITCTTRPKRENEEDGKNYHFLSPQDFGERVLNGDMIEATCFKEDWFYGTDIHSLEKDKINIGVFNPDSVRCLMDSKDLQVIYVYIYVKPKTQLMRALEREENPNCEEICRRFLADKKRFLELEVEEDIDYIYFDNEAAAPDYTGLISSIKSKLFS